MKLNYIKYLFIFCSLFLVNLHSYSQELDSLKKRLEEHTKINKNDKEGIEILKKMFLLAKEPQPYYAIEIAGEAMQMAKEIKDPKNEALMYEWIADIYKRQRVYYLAMDYYFKAVKIYREINDINSEANTYVELGYTYLEQNVEDLAEEYYKKASKKFLSQKNKLGEFKALKALGELYAYQENFVKAVEIYEQAKLKLNNEEPEKQGEILEAMAKVYIQEEESEKAKLYLQQALIKYKINSNKDKVADIYLQYGQVYTKNKEYDKALKNLKNALFINNDLKRYDKISEIYNKIAYIFYRQKKYKETIDKSQNSLNYNNNYFKEAENSYKYISRSYSKLGDDTNALKFLKKYLRAHDRLHTEKENKQFTEMQVSLELQQHEKEVEILKREQVVKGEALKRSRLQTYFLLFGVIIFILFSYYYYKTNQRTKKANVLLKKQKEEILEQKEQLALANSSILEQQKLIERKNKDIQAGIDYAHRIQFALIPEIAEFQKIIPESFVLLRPKDKISGDFYWIVRKRHVNKIFVAAVDCTGHGIPGAFMSVLGNTLLNQIIQMGIYEADEILNHLHKMIRKALHQESTPNRDGMDMALCVIDKEKNRMEYAGAKNPLVYFKEGEMNIIKADKFSIGGIQREKHRHFTKHIIDLDKNLTVYLYSDGIQDQFGGEFKQKYTRNQLRNTLKSVQKESLSTQKERVNESINKWMKSYEQIDDMLLLGFKL